MERLKERDLRHALTFVREIHAQPDLDSFARRVVDRLSDIVPGHRVSYNEVQVGRGTLRVVVRPADGIPVLAAHHYREHPMTQRFLRTGDGRAHTFSDFMTRAQLHATAMYQDHYRAARVEHQITVILGPPSPRLIGFAVSRDLRDFSERDRLVMNLLRPHLAAAYARASATARAQAQLALLARAAEVAAAGVVLLDRRGHVEHCTRQARDWLQVYFPRRGRPSSRRLPPEVEDWLARQSAAEAATDLTTPATPYVVTRDDRRLVIRLVGGPGEPALLLEESGGELAPATLAALGLSPREREVLALVARGSSNAAIAHTLGARPRTVAKHVERIHRKLGVENRTAAAVRVHELVGAALRSD